MSNWLHISAVVLALTVFTSAVDINGNINPADPETDSEYAEGDLVGNTDGPIQLWPNGIVPYRICIHLTGEYPQVILDTMALIEEKTCIKFIPKNDCNEAYLNFTGYPNLGCFSYLGYQGGIQKLNLQMDDPLGTGCYRDGVPLHVILHALGLRHMHNDPRRDDFIDVISENVVPANLVNLQKYPQQSQYPGSGLNYDLESVMHYGRKAFSEYGDDTIVPKDPTANIGIKNQLSKLDIKRLNKMYNCRGRD